MKNFQKANELFKAKGYDLNDESMITINELTNLVDGYFVNNPDLNLFKDADDEDKNISWRVYLVSVIEEVSVQVQGGELRQPTSDRELEDLTKLIPEIF